MKDDSSCLLETCTRIKRVGASRSEPRRSILYLALCSIARKLTFHPLNGILRASQMLRPSSISHPPLRYEDIYIQPLTRPKPCTEQLVGTTKKIGLVTMVGNKVFQ